MGTELFLRGLQSGECAMGWNEKRPADVAAVHEAYAKAGCQIITSNSFSGTRSMLGRHGSAEKTVDWNRLAVALARKALGSQGWVLGDVGPFGDFLEPFGETTPEELHLIFKEQISALVEAGANAILVETMSDPNEAAAGVQSAKAVCELPVVVTFAFQKAGDQFRTMMGASTREALATVIEAGADIVGANCGTDLSLAEYLALAVELKAVAGDVPVILQPNAGTPKNTDQGLKYDTTPAEMAEMARALRDTGISIIGGCCGTTPRHLAAMAAALR